MRGSLLPLICQDCSRVWTPDLECKSPGFPWEVMSSGLTDVNLTFLSSFIILNNSVLGTRIHPFHCQKTSSVSNSPWSRLPFTDRAGIPRIPEMAAKPFHAKLGSGVLKKKRKSKLNGVLNILFLFAKEFQVILKYVEGCLVTTVS